MNEGKKFRRLALRVKIFRWIGTVMIVLVVLMLVALGSYKLTQMKAANESNEQMNYLEMVSQIMAPNIQTSELRLKDTSLLGGQVFNRRFKDVEGVHVPWSSLTATYSWLYGSHISGNINAVESNGTSGAVYDQETQQKVPVFYNPRLKKAAEKPAHDLQKIANQRHAVVEMGVTFKEPLSYAAIQQRLPKGVHPAWYWIGVEKKADPTFMDNNLFGLNVQNAAGTLNEDDYRGFHQGLVYAHQHDLGLSYDDVNIFKFAGQYAKQHPKLRTAKFAGLIVTGNSEAFKPLLKATWIANSSVGIYQTRKPVK
ncbi:sigma factor regulator N-terminal domain-containing protein [Levilactobacillus yonginensis]|uniref:sigma factor regulator N-terminal domain-containing protein n=1 Tax=Levilactobacillus yonginensis TaxID=1054041 RepID=UPI00345DD6E0